MTSPLIDVFISHNSKDKGFIDNIVNRLHDEFDIQLWLDKWSLQAATDWAPAIEKALQTCTCCAVVLGANGWGPHHLGEAQLALKRKREHPNFRVIPILLSGATKENMQVLGDFFQQVHRVDFTGSSNEEEAFQRLWAAIRGEMPGPPLMTAYKIERDAKYWQRLPAKNKNGALYAGEKLRNAQEIAANAGEPISEIAQAFLRASVEDERARIRQAQRRTRKIIAGLTLGLIILAVAASVALAERSEAVRQRGTAEEQTKIATKQREIAEDQTKVANEQREEADRQRVEAETQREEAKKQANIAEASRQAESEQRKRAEAATENERQARKRLEQQLLVTSSQALSTNALAGNVKPDRAVLLAAEAVEKFRRVGQAPLPKANYALMMAVSRAGKIDLLGNEWSLRAASISKNRRWLMASVYNERGQAGKGRRGSSILIWDLESETPWASLIELSVEGAGSESSTSNEAVSDKKAFDVLAIGDSGKRLAAASKAHGQIYFWDLNRRKTALALEPPKVNFENLELDDGERWLSAGSHLYDLASAEPELHKLGGSEVFPRGRFSPNGKVLVAWGPKKLLCWKLPAHQPCGLSYTTGEDNEQISGISFSPNDDWMAVWINGGAAPKAVLGKLGDANTSASLRDLKIYSYGERESKISDALFSPDGRYLVIIGSLLTEAVWELKNGQFSSEPDLPLGDMSDTIFSATFSKDSKLLITSGNDVSGWGADNRFAKSRFSFRAPTASLLRFSPSGKWLVSGGAIRYSIGGENSRPWIWDLEAKDPEMDPIILGGASFDHGLAETDHYFSSNNRWVVSIIAGPASELSIFPLELPDLMLAAGQAVKRNFTKAEWDSLFPGERYQETFPDHVLRSLKAPPFTKPWFH